MAAAKAIAGKDDVLKLLRDLDGPCTASFITTALAIPSGSVYNHLRRLMDDGDVKCVKETGEETTYRVVPRGCLLADIWKGVAV